MTKHNEDAQRAFRDGMASYQQGRLAEAEKICTALIGQRRDDVEALHLLGIIFCRTQRTEQGADLIGRAIGFNPSVAAFHSSLGNALIALGRTEEALTSYDNAIALRPDYATPHNNRGNALNDLGRYQDALKSFDKAIALKSDYAEAYYNRGAALKKLGRPADALASFDKAIALKPDYAEAHGNRGVTLAEMGRSEEALASYDQVTAFNPKLAEAYINRGNALMELKRPKEALASYNRAIALKPESAESYVNRGKALLELRRLEDAIANFDRAIALNSQDDYIEGVRLNTKMQLCDWRNFNAEHEHLIESIRSRPAKIAPFTFLSVASTSNDQFLCAQRYSSEKCPPLKPAIWQGKPHTHDRIRIAYLSADFREHAIAYLVAGLIERHDRSRFEVFGVSFGDDDGGETRKRLISAFDVFHDVRGKSDQEVAMLLREMEADIAIDLQGYTRNCRPGIFARRPVPIQVNYLGYPGTLGTKSMDYIIADSIVVPPGQSQFYAEKIVSLPNSYQVNDSERQVAERSPSRRELGLPETGFVFCCFNNSYKVMPNVFEIWIRLLKRVEGSVLWLLEDNPVATANLKKEGETRGVYPQRLVFAGRMPLAAHLARHRCADLFIDTLPYNAHTTASDALWTGLPVLTCIGETFAGRVAASLLSAIDSPELITRTPEDYERAAIELATEPERLAKIRKKLARNRLTTPLFDTARFTRHIEAAYNAMHERHKAGLAPAHIAIPDSHWV